METGTRSLAVDFSARGWHQGSDSWIHQASLRSPVRCARAVLSPSEDLAWGSRFATTASPTGVIGKLVIYNIKDRSW